MFRKQQFDLDPEEAWRQVLARDASAGFFYAVVSTGIFCRPACPSRRPAQPNVRFFSDAAGALAAGYRACKRCSPLGAHPEAALVTQLARYVDARPDRTISLGGLAKLAKASPFTIQRKFQRLTGVSPREYQSHLRAGHLRSSLSTPGRSITESIYQAGYGSSSRFYEHAVEHLGMSATRFREGGRGETIRFTTSSCTLGLVLVAATERGLCSVMLGDEPGALEGELRAQFREAKILPDAEGLAEYLSGILAGMTDHPLARDLPLDLRATAFQARVWLALRKIPRGETRSYAELACELDQPKAVRAVARACASNPVAIAIPCHRVVGSDGTLTGYRWGVERKQKLLDLEKNPARQF